MLRQKPLVVSLILAGLMASSQVAALGLERLNVSTAIGQPLVAEVDITIAPGDDIDSIRANIASPAVYRSAGVEYQGILQTIRVQVLRRPNGQPYLRLASSQSINDPYLDILVEVNSSTGRLVREYVFLLDPPATAVTQAIEPSQPLRPAMPAQTSPAASAAASAVAPRSGLVSQAAVLPPSSPARPVAATANASGNYTVRTGDTLSAIAGRNAQPGVSIEQLMIAIQRSNPDAFIGGNINRLRAAATLAIPTSGDAQSIAQANAVSEVRAQAATWRGYVARVSDSVPYVAADQPSARASGRVTGAVADNGGRAANADKLKLSQGERNKQTSAESKVAATKALKEEQSRAAQLEKTRLDLEKALQLKNQALADAQAKAKDAAKAPPAPPPIAIAKAEPAKAIAPPPAPVPIAPIAPVAPVAPVAAPVPPPVAVAPPPPPPAPPPAPTPPPPPPPAPVPPPPVVAPVTPPPPAVIATPRPVAPPVVAAADSGSGIMDMLGDNPMPAAAAGLGILGLLGAFVWSRRRKTVSSGVDTRSTEPVVNTINPDTVFGTSGLGVVKTNDVPVQSQFSRSGMGTIDSGEVDPVAEAEVYIAYGREAQAEEILREALQRDPLRPDVATKLAEISATQGKRDSFDQLAADIAAMDRTGDYKAKLATIAAAHFPGHPLIGTAASAADSQVTYVAPSISAAAAVPVAAATAAVTAATAAAAAAVAYTSLDTMTSPGRSAPSAAPPSNGSLDFVLDGMTIAAPTNATVSAAFEVPVINVPPANAALVSAPPKNRKSLEDDLAELEASLKKATTSGQLPESGMDFTDFSTATPTNLGTVGPSMRPEMLDLSFDAGRQGFVDPTPSILDGQWHDASTKLDLARAYEEMGDREGAREILREVIHDGDEVQIAEAKTMLAKLGG
jgi:pilus assembly protein FimV